jgi:hypothetical protein
VPALADVSLGDIGRAVRRYQPVALTVLAVLVVVVLSDPIPRPAGDEDIPGPRAAAATGAASDTDPSAEPPLLGALPDPGPGQVLPPPGFVADLPADAIFVPPPVADSAPAPGGETPLRVVAKAWASQAGGTPVATVGVPAGTLPVGTRLGQADKASYVRLSGTGTVLALTEDPQGARTSQGAPAVQACQITDAAWQEAEAMSFSDAPPHDAATCAAGTRSADGQWSFDLSRFPFRTDTRGFALVPAADAPLDFQVAFRTA